MGVGVPDVMAAFPSSSTVSTAATCPTGDRSTCTRHTRKLLKAEQSDRENFLPSHLPQLTFFESVTRRGGSLVEESLTFRAR
jgi:hypothetical protein